VRGEERPCRDFSTFGNPQRIGQWEIVVARGEVGLEMEKGVVLKLFTSDDDVVSLKIAVGFMMKEVKCVQVVANADSIPTNNLPPVTN